MPAPVLTLDHLQAYAAWLHYGPGTIRQVAGRSDMAMIGLHPRTAELLELGAVKVFGQSATEGPIYTAITAEVILPSATDIAERQLNTLPVRDQVSIAAGIMARHGRRHRHTAQGEREQLNLQ